MLSNQNILALISGGESETVEFKKSTALMREAVEMGLFENWGSGTLKIIEETVKAGQPEPLFSFEDGIFTVELLRRPYG